MSLSSFIVKQILLHNTLSKMVVCHSVLAEILIVMFSKYINKPSKNRDLYMENESNNSLEVCLGRLI